MKESGKHLESSGSPDSEIETLPPLWGPSELPVPARYGRAVWIVTFAGLTVIGALALSSGLSWVLAWPLPGGLLTVGLLLGMRFRRGVWMTRFSTRRWVVGVLGVALVLRLACVLLTPYHPVRDFAAYHDAGVDMAKNWTLGTGYRCFWPPGQIFSLGVVYRLSNNSVLAGQILNVIYATLTVLGVWYIARKVFGDRVARSAILLAAMLPSTIFACMLQGAEVPEAFWLVLALCFYVGAVDRTSSLLAGLACGLSLGIGALIRPTYLLLPVPIALHMLLSSPRRGRAALCGAAIALGTCLAVLPWTIRNYCVTGGVILISSNGGGNLYSANNPDSNGGYTKQAWELLTREAHDDVSLQRLGMKKAGEWIRKHPGQFIYLMGPKFYHFWSGDRDTTWWAMTLPTQLFPELNVPRWWQLTAMEGATMFYSICLLAGAFGVYRARRRMMRDRAWMVLPVLAVYFTAVHMVFESQAKYHYMLAPLLCIFAALATLTGPVVRDHNASGHREEQLPSGSRAP